MGKDAISPGFHLFYDMRQPSPVLQMSSSRALVNEGKKKDVKACQECKASYILTGSLKEHWMRDKGNETDNDSIQNYDSMIL